MKNVFVLVAAISAFACFAEDASAQIFARNRDVNVNANGVRVEVDRRLFGRDQVRVNGVRVDNRRNANRGRDINVAVVDPVAAARANAAFAPRATLVFSNGHRAIVPTAAVGRFNAFGVFTKQDAFGNVFEIDSFGNARFVGNNLNRGFQGTVFRSSSFGVPFASSAVFVPRGACH